MSRVHPSDIHRYLEQDDMAALTETERQHWQRAYAQSRADRHRQCTSPVTPANPITPRTPGQYVGTLCAPKG